MGENSRKDFEVEAGKEIAVIVEDMSIIISKPFNFREDLLSEIWRFSEIFLMLCYAALGQVGPPFVSPA